MRHISSYTPKVSQVLLALGAGLVLTLTGCSSPSQTPAAPVATVTVKAAATAEQTFIQGYDILVEMIPLPEIALPPLPDTDLQPLPEFEPYMPPEAVSLPQPNVEMPPLPGDPSN